MKTFFSKACALLAFPAVALATGCAVAPADPNAPPPPELTYRTGSNIPIRDKAPLTQEDKDRQAADVQELQQRMLGNSGVRSGK